MGFRNQTLLNCPNCGNSFSGTVEQIFDVGRDPRAKARLLSGQANTTLNAQIANLA